MEMKAIEANRIANYINNINNSLDELLKVINESARKGDYSVVVNKSFRIAVLEELIKLGYVVEEVGDKVIIQW